MPTPRSSRPRPLAYGWLVIAALVAAGGAVVYLKPDLLSGFTGTVRVPGDLGPLPQAPGGVNADLAMREREAEMAGAPVTVAKPSDAAKPVVTKPVAKVAAPTNYPDEAKAAALLSTAEESYKAYAWTKAASTAKQVLELKAAPLQLGRAREMIQGSTTMADLFKQLDERDELNRNYDTNPSVVSIDINGRITNAVPVTDLANKIPTVVEKDPVAFLKAQQKAGVLTLLIEGKTTWTATELRTDKVLIGAITKVDTAKILTDRRSEFTTNLKRLTAGEGARDALTWYAAAKFAYRNRLDDQVTDLLDRAIDLDPKLAATIREDKAALLFASVVAHMKDGNQRQADAYMAIVTKRYADTDQGRQARLFYDGKNTELLAAAKAADQKRKTDDDAARQARLKRAQDKGDDASAKAIAAEPVDEEPADTDSPVAATGDEGKADELTALASKKAAKAMDLGNTNERDVIYGEGKKIADQAVKLYVALINKEKNPKKKEDLEAKTLAANKIKFMCIKYMRPFH